MTNPEKKDIPAATSEPFAITLEVGSSLANETGYGAPNARCTFPTFPLQ